MDPIYYDLIEAAFFIIENWPKIKYIYTWITKPTKKQDT